MPTITVPFGRFLPDQASFRNPGVITAKNVIPMVGSYAPFKDLGVVSNAISAQVLGACFARSNAGVNYMYAGDATKLYEMVNTTWTDQSKGGGYTVASGDNWEFAVYNRNNVVIATNYTDAVQSLTIGNGAGANFADMITGTNTPKAKHIAIVGQFVMLGYTNDSSDGERQSRVWWSAIGNQANFDPDASTQSDYEDLSSGGMVQKILGLTEYGLIFQREMVRTARYVGGGTIFELLPLNYAPGTPLPNSVISHKNRAFYISEDGFMSINGASVEPIGHSGIDKYFWGGFDTAHRRNMSAAIDPVNKLVCWACSWNNSGSSLPNKLFIYNYVGNKWAEIDCEVDLIVRAETVAFTLDGLDTLGTNIDDASVFNVSFDSDKWSGGKINLSAFNRDHKLAYFTEGSKPATIITGDIQPVDGRSWQINAVRPLIDGEGAAVSAAPRTRLKDVVSYLGPSEMNFDGQCNLRTDGRYQRIRTSITSSVTWSHIQGLQIDYQLTGER